MDMNETMEIFSFYKNLQNDDANQILLCPFLHLLPVIVCMIQKINRE